jgi:malonate decarboxylase alpha subunit
MQRTQVSSNKSWTTRRDHKRRRLLRVASYCDGRVINPGKMIRVPEELLEPDDRVCLEGNNQKQADFLSRMLAQVDPARIQSLHLLIPVLPEHMELLERKMASRVDFSFAGPQASRLAEMVSNREIQIGAIHTYLELFARYLVDLTPDVSLIAADCADAEGSLYSGANTEETPLIVEATAFRDGIVVAQVNEIHESLPRVDIPGSWVDLIVL